MADIRVLDPLMNTYGQLEGPLKVIARRLMRDYRMEIRDRLYSLLTHPDPEVRMRAKKMLDDTRDMFTF